MPFVLFQKVRNVHERIRIDSFRDSGQKTGIEPAEGGVILERNLIHVTSCIVFWRLG